MSLKQKAISGVFWTLSQQLSIQAINFFVQIILARLLMPEVFGLIAMLNVFIAIGQTLMDSGMTSSLIRTQKPTQTDYSTVFYTNILVSIALYVLLFFLAPAIAQFYKQPVLSDILRVYTLAFIIKSLVGVQTTKLTKDLNFKLQMKMQIPSTIAGACGGIYLAYKGFGVWSLVWLNLIQSFLFMIQHWIFSNWRPSLVLNREAFKFHFNFGSKLTVSSLIDTVYSNSYNILIGKFFNPATVGYYNQADTFRLFPVSQLSFALDKVTYPLFSSIQDDDEKLKEVYKKIMLLILFFIIPLMTFLIIVATPLFRLVLGTKWLPAVPYFQILSIASILRPIGTYNTNILKVKGKSNLFLRLEIIKKTIGIAVLVIALPFGIMALVWSAAFIAVIFAFLNAVYCGRFINYYLKEQLKDIGPLFFIGAITGVLTFALDFFVYKIYLPVDVIRLLLDFISLCVIYLALYYYFNRSFLMNLQLFFSDRIKTLPWMRKVKLL